MKRGEKAVLAIIGLVVAAGMLRSLLHVEEQHDREIPFYSTASNDVASKAMDIYRSNNCRNCHTLWTLKNMMESVPAPMLDGIGSIRTESWIYDYLSSADPQSVLPSRLKKEYRMPSYSKMPDEERRVLSAYLASLKVKDWYLDQTKKLEFEKLNGTEPPK
jgi:cbb3-type cytochrome oxidase cytochrome c subunit